MTKYEVLAITIASISLILTLYRWWLDRGFAKQESRRQFFQKLIDGFFVHNWKFIEYWQNEGIRPWMESTKDVEENFTDFGRRVVILDHLNILWQIYLHHKILTKEDIESFGSWARSWINDSTKDQLKIIFKDGDLFPLDYIIWIRDKVFKGEFEPLMGSGLKNRIGLYETSKKKSWWRFWS